jgi:peptidoglycan-associated lipoprotein
MGGMKRMSIVLMAAALVAGAGCKKKAPKTETPPPAAASGVAEAPASAATPPSRSVILERVHFPLDRAELTTEATRTLAEDAKKLLANPTLRIRVEGHADERGSTVYNLALSGKRAAAVRRYLVDLGVASERIETVAYGEERPLVDADGEPAWSKNRRGDLVVTGSASAPAATR